MDSRCSYNIVKVKRTKNYNTKPDLPMRWSNQAVSFMTKSKVKVDLKNVMLKFHVDY